MRQRKIAKALCFLNSWSHSIYFVIQIVSLLSWLRGSLGIQMIFCALMSSTLGEKFEMQSLVKKLSTRTV